MPNVERDLVAVYIYPAVVGVLLTIETKIQSELEYLDVLDDTNTTN